MQAIILAAGMGKRLGDITKDRTKCMIEVHSQTLIERMLAQLAGEGMKRIILVTGYKGERLRELVGDSFQGVPVVYVENPIYDKTNNIYSLFLARRYLSEDDTILLESDLIFEDRILSRLVRHPYPNITVVAKYQSWMDGTVVTLDEDCNILNFIPKQAFCYKDKDSYYKTVNIYKFSLAFSSGKYIPFLEAYSKALGNNEYYEQVLRVISLLDKPELKAMTLADEKWYEIDDAQDIDNAEALFATAENATALYSSRYGGYWRFPQLTDFCYLVNPYFPPRRMVEELAANFETLLTEYPSGMQVNAQLAARFTNVSTEQIVAGNGAAELIKALMQLQPVKTGIILPSFEEYANRLSADNRIAYTPPGPDFAYTADELIRFFSAHPLRQLILINPDNPSGHQLPQDELLQLVEWTEQQDIRLVVDESFADFAGQRCSFLNRAFLSAHPRLVVVKSISKSYGVPGLRLGFLASGDTALIKRIKADIAIWNINSFAEFFMQIFIKYQDKYAQGREDFIRERQRFRTALEEIPFLRVIPSSANYFLCEVCGGMSSKTLCSRLLSGHNMLLKDCATKAGFAGRAYVRIAVRNTEDNDRLIRALHQLSHEQSEAEA